MKNNTELQQANWADFNKETNQLKSFTGKQPLTMAHSDGTALPLLVDTSLPANFGADIIRFDAGKGVSLHKHIGSHILMVTKGTGILTYNSNTYPMFEGMIYLIPSNIPHAISAETELVLVAIGNDHQTADSETRLEIVQNE
jgi:quercetin dioxygenase-like cupin family protein